MNFKKPSSLSDRFAYKRKKPEQPVNEVADCEHQCASEVPVPSTDQADDQDDFEDDVDWNALFEMAQPTMDDGAPDELTQSDVASTVIQSQTITMSQPRVTQPPTLPELETLIKCILLYTIRY